MFQLFVGHLYSRIAFAHFLSELACSVFIPIARQAACGLVNKPKEEKIIDIDAADADNELAAVEYIEDMYKFFKLVEVILQIFPYIYNLQLYFLGGCFL